MQLTKIQEIIKTQNTIDKLEIAKRNFKTNTSIDNFDTTKNIKDLPAILDIGNLKNDKGNTFENSILFIQDQWFKMLDSYVKALQKEQEKI